MTGPVAAAHRVLWASRDELRGLAPDSWDEVAGLAAKEELAGFLYCRSLEAGAAVPERLRQAWHMAHRHTATGNLVALHGVSQALQRLADRGLEVLLMPGASLLPLYPDLGCRPMDDVDLLVRPGQASRVGACLRDQGFRSPERHAELFTSGGLLLDLHEDLLNSARIRSRRRAGWMDLGEVWRDSRPVAVAGVRVPAMGGEDTLLYTALHALRHGFSRVTWFLDLHLLMQTGLDWTLVADKADRYGLQRPLAYAILFLQEQARVEVPGPAQALAHRVRLGAVEEALVRRAFQERGRGQWGDLLWAFNVPGRVDRWRFVVETAFPRPAVLLQVFPYLPRPLFPLAYGLRLGQLLLRGARQLTLVAGRARAFERDHGEGRPN